jgi:hypothetical protein
MPRVAWRLRDRISLASFAALATVIGVAAAVIGVAVGSLTASHGTPSSRSGGSLRVGNASLRYASDWKPATPARIPGLQLEHVTAVAPSGRDEEAGLVAGVLPASVGSPLPPALLGQLEDRARVAVVTFGAFNAYRYDSVRIAGFHRPLTLYSIPGQRSSTVVACFGSDAKDRSACERMVATFDATIDPFGPVTYALTPSAAYARNVTAAIARLDATRRTARAGLPGQPPARQAELAGELAAAYDTAAGALAAVERPEAVSVTHAHLVAGLRAAAAAYGSMETAARGHNAAAYRAASAGVGGAEKDTTWALAELDAFGYADSVGPVPAGAGR